MGFASLYPSYARLTLATSGHRLFAWLLARGFFRGLITPTQRLRPNLFDVGHFGFELLEKQPRLRAQRSPRRSDGDELRKQRRINGVHDQIAVADVVHAD